MPKRVPEGAKRVPLNCLISPETKRLLEKLRERTRSQGEIVDQAVAAWAELGRTLARSPLAELHSRPVKGPLLKPSEKKR